LSNTLKSFDVSAFARHAGIDGSPESAIFGLSLEDAAGKITRRDEQKAERLASWLIRWTSRIVPPLSNSQRAFMLSIPSETVLVLDPLV
jgi:hypothetical protein